MSTRVKSISKSKSPVTIISDALELFKDGKAWNNYTLYDDEKETYCALGALRTAASGSAYGDVLGPYKKAADIVASCVPAKYEVEDGYGIPNWNDNLPAGRRGFRSIKAVFCKALKKAIDAEMSAKKARKSNGKKAA